jgi:hypothetical protein
MSDSGWSDYVGSDTVDAATSTVETTDDAPPADSGDGADTAAVIDDPGADGATADAGDASTDIGDAASSADWAAWDNATADAADQSADSYLTAAEQDLNEGWTEGAAQNLADAGAQESYAADQSATAADYSASADASLSDASADIASADTTE